MIRHYRQWLWLGWVALLAACSQPDPVYTQESYVFGTRVLVSIYGEPESKAKAATAAVLADLDRLHHKLHAWQPSPLTRLNQALAQSDAPQPIDAELQNLLQLASRYALLSDELFNPAIGSLVGAWGFHADEFKPVRPSAEQLHKLLNANPRMADLEFGAGRVSSHNRAVQIDLGGIAKGWALDREAAYLRRQHIPNALINIGGNIMALGSKGKEAWKVGLQHPRKPEAMAALALNDGEAIGTSGDYQRYFELDGQRYCHLIDPRNGLPAAGMQAATVVAPPGMDAGAISDAATKPLFIGGIDSAQRYSAHFGLKLTMLINSKGDIYLSPALQRRIKWLGEKPRVHLLW